MAKKMNSTFKFALAAGAVFGAVALYRNEKVRQWSRQNANKLRDSSLGSNVAELTDWSRDRFYELRDPQSKTSRLVKVLPAGNYIQRALEVILPDQSSLDKRIQRAGRKAEEMGSKAKDLAETAGEKAHDVADRAGDSVQSFADRAGARAKDMGTLTSDGIHAASDHASDMAREASDRLDTAMRDKNEDNRERNRVKSAS